MAAVNTKSLAISNRDAQPKTINPGYLDGGSLRTKRGTVEKATTDSDGSVFRFFPIRSNDVVNSLELFNDALTGATVYTVGLYLPAKSGGSVVSANVFAASGSLAAASTSGTNLTFAAVDIANIGKRVWEVLGLSADPQLEYDVALTLTTAGAAAGTISLRASVVNGT
jgi:hypothetical protein